MSSSLVHDPKNNTKEKAVANDNKNFYMIIRLCTCYIRNY